MKQSSHSNFMTTLAVQFRRIFGVFGLLSLAVVLAGCLSRPSMKTKTFAFSAPWLTATNTAPDGCVDRIVEVARGRMRVVNGRKSVRWRGAD